MSEIKTLEIPKWGLSMEEGTIAQWLIQEGTQFSKGQEICEIETTKIVNVLEAPFDGLLRKIIAKDGDTLVVGGVIAICADAQVSDTEVEAFAQSLGGTPAVTENKAVAAVPEKVAVAQVETKVQAAPKQNSVGNVSKAMAQGGYSIPAALQGYQQSDDIFATPHALKLAEKHNVNLSQITGSGREGRISVQDIQTAVQAAGGSWPDVRHQASTKAAKSKADDSDVLATPVARRLARQWGINLHDCRASGSRGRVCKEDVEAVYQRENPVQAQHTEYAHPTESAKFTTVAMNGMRKAIAARLQAAKRNAPHFRLTIDLNVESVQALRQQINSTVPQVKLSINDMLIKAAAAALIKVPQVNVQFDEENQQILQFEQADISVAVAIENGLITQLLKQRTVNLWRKFPMICAIWRHVPKLEN